MTCVWAGLAGVDLTMLKQKHNHQTQCVRGATRHSIGGSVHAFAEPRPLSNSAPCNRSSRKLTSYTQSHARKDEATERNQHGIPCCHSVRHEEVDSAGLQRQHRLWPMHVYRRLFPLMHSPTHTHTQQERNKTWQQLQSCQLHMPLTTGRC